MFYVCLNTVTQSSYQSLSKLKGNVNMFPFNSCSTISISGTTGSGKTTFVRKLIQNMAEMFEPVTPRRVLYCYGVYQNEFQVMESRFPFVTFQKGLPSDSDIEELSGDHNLIVIDDLMNE